MQVQSADGVIHEFPDGTDPAVVDRAMKAYVAAPQQKAHTPYNSQFFPIAKDAQGNYSLAVPGILKDAATIPERAYRESESLRTGGFSSDEPSYNAGPALEAATLANQSLRFGTKMSTSADLRTAAKNQYESPPVSELRINPEGTSQLAKLLVAEAEKKGLRPYQKTQGAGEVYGAANELAGMPSATSVPKGTTVFQPEISGPGYQMGSDVFKPAPVTVQDIAGVRTSLGSTVKAGTDTLTGDLTPIAGRAQQMRGGITDYLNNIPAEDVVSGNSKLAAEILRNAGADYSASKKIGILDALERRADIKRGASNSGKNLNTERQEVKSFILNQKNARGLSDDQMAAAETAAVGTIPGNVARSIANKWDQSGGLSAQNMMSHGGAGSAAAYAANKLLGTDIDPVLAGIVMALSAKGAGKVARGVANASEQRSLDKFRQSILEESPSARRSMAWDEAQARRAALVKALLFGGLAPQ